MTERKAVMADVARCPVGSMQPAHYKEDGICKCPKIGGPQAALFHRIADLCKEVAALDEFRQEDLADLIFSRLSTDEVGPLFDVLLNGMKRRR